MKGFSVRTLGMVCLLLVASLTTSVGAPVEGGPVIADAPEEIRGEAAVKVPAVPLGGNQPAGGLPTVIHVKVEPGDGDVFMATQPLTEPDFQVAARTAVRAAANATGVNVSNVDVLVSVQAPLASVVEGPSAGAAVAVATAAALLDRDIRPAVAITGTVTPTGGIGTVGALDRKTQAAAEAGAQTFIVPSGSQEAGPSMPAVRLGPGVLILSKPNGGADLSKLEAEHGIELRQVSTVGQALEVAVDPYGLGNGPAGVPENPSSAPSEDGRGPLAFQVPSVGILGTVAGVLAAVAVVAGLRGRGRRGPGR